MHPAYPNPFNPTTTIVYEINSNDVVNISVYDVLGRNMETLVNNTKTLDHIVSFGMLQIIQVVFTMLKWFLEMFLKCKRLC